MKADKSGQYLEETGKGPYQQPPNNVPETGFAPQAAYPAPDFTPYDSVYGNSAHPPNQHVPTNNESEPIVKGFEFDSASIRRGFIRKVYAILSLQLSVTLAFVILVTHHDATREFVQMQFPVAVCAIVLVIVSIITISCCESARRTSPTNIIWLSLFTISEGYLVGFTTTVYDPEIVWLAILFTTVVVVALTVFAMQTKWDFTTMGGTLFVALWIFILVGFLMAFFPKTNAVIIIFSSFGAILFSIYLIHDTQLIVGGEHKFSISPEEYVLGAITLFLDIINIFLYILRILSAASKN